MVERSEIEQAAARLESSIHVTPLLGSSFFNDFFGAQLFFKAENFQKTGSFKVRGALNSLMQLSSEDREGGVATHSSGNHAQALAWAAKLTGTRAYIVMPENAPAVKVAAVRDYGAEIRFCEPSLEARETGLNALIEETGAVFIPPYNYRNTIIGQATCSLEIINEIGAPDLLLTPVGGGGLLSGSALSAKYWAPGCRVIGCEPARADDAYRSFRNGRLIPSVNPDTIADGLRTSLGDLTFEIIKELVSDILRCSESSILKAMRMIWERMKIVVEPSAAVPLACMLEDPSIFAGKKVAIILSGGNVDLDKSPFKKA